MDKELLSEFPEWSREWIENRYPTDKEDVISIQEILNIKDYLMSMENDSKFKSKLYKLTWKDIQQRSHKWHDDMETKEIERLLVGGNPDDVKVVMELPGGHQWVHILTPEGLDYEGNAMGHCVGRGAYDDTDKYHIYSLRDKDGIPHVTLEYRSDCNYIMQIQGRGNKKPHKKYHQAIHEMIFSFDKVKFPNQQNFEPYYGFIQGGPSPEPDKQRLYDITKEKLPNPFYNGESYLKKITRGEHSLVYIMSERLYGEQNISIQDFDVEMIDILENILQEHQVTKITSGTSRVYGNTGIPGYWVDVNYKLHDMDSLDLPKTIVLHPSSLNQWEPSVIFPIIIDNVSYGHISLLNTHVNRTISLHDVKINDITLNAINEILTKYHKYIISSDVVKSNFIVGRTSRKSKNRLFMPHEIPPFVVENISLANISQDINIPDRITFINSNGELSKKGMIILRNIDGDININGKFRNRNIEIFLKDCNGNINLPTELDNVTKIALEGTWQYGKIPQYTNITDIDITLPDGTETKEFKDLTTKLQSIKDENDYIQSVRQP